MAKKQRLHKGVRLGEEISTAIRLHKEAEERIKRLEFAIRAEVEHSEISGAPFVSWDEFVSHLMPADEGRCERGRMETVRELAGQLRTLDYDDTIGDVGLDNLVIVTVQERIDRGHKTIKDLWDQAQELKAAAHTMKETAERKELLARFWAARAKSKNKPGELESLLPMAEPATDEALHGGRLPHAEDGPDQGEHCGSVGHDV